MASSNQQNPDQKNPDQSPGPESGVNPSGAGGPSDASGLNQNPTGWGALVALLVVVGAILGSMAGQPSIGFLGGLSLGLLIALGFWLRDRR